MITNYATGDRFQGESPVVEVLEGLDDWADLETLAGRVRLEREEILPIVQTLLERSIVESMTAPADGRERAMAQWRGWNPAAGFFHAATRDLAYSRERRSVPVLTDLSYPPALKTYPDARFTELPAYDAGGEVARVLLERRSWRRFDPRPVAIEDVATLLGLVWGVQKWLHHENGESLALKTSPSGGARHSLEVYLLAFDVEGLAEGTYHYQPNDHRLVDLGVSTSRAGLKDFLPAQAWFEDAAAVFFMTSVFERVHWKYSYARAYRTVLLEAGHFSQTFLLAATSLGLAPFCTAAIGDSAVEQHLGIDGIAESVVFANGIGRRPEGVSWAPTPEGEPIPRLTIPVASPLKTRAAKGEHSNDQE